VRGYITYRAGAKLSFGQMVGCAVLLIPAVFFAGKAIAYRQIFFGDLYTILTEDPKPIEKAHLVRRTRSSPKAAALSLSDA
jgi:hypothetical protein